MSQRGDVLEARQCFTDAEKSGDRTKSVELYTNAARHYLNAAREVEDDALKRSLIYLSNCCSQKAAKRAAAGWKPAVNRPADDTLRHSDTTESHRLLHLAHLQRLKGVEKVPRRSESTAFQVVKDMLLLEAALASIGFKNPKASEKVAPPENMLRSTFAFTSDLGESFMVLDPKGQPHLANAAHQRRSAPSRVADTQPRDPNQTVVQWNDSNVAESVMLPAHRKHSNPNTTRDMYSQDAERERRLQHTVKQEIENELNDPLVQSYLSTHAQSTMVRSQYDADNLTQSTISAFNKDTIDNAKGVLNLLQTVRRIGEENTQLLLRIEHLTHLEERSARVYKDIDSFKQEFAEKFDDLKDLLTEHVHNMSQLHQKPPGAAGSSGYISAVAPGGGDADVPLPLRDPLSSVILQEIRARKEAARIAAAAKAESEAQDNARRSSDAAASNPGAVPSAIGAGNAGIAEKAADQPGSGGMSVVRQQQLEKMVKNILARLDKALLEIKQKDALLEKYVRVINKMQQQRPKDESGEIEGLELSSLTVASSAVGVGTGMGTGTGGGTGSIQPRDASSSSRDGVGGVVSTYRKPPSPSSAYNASVASLASMSADVYGAPLPPGPVVRTSSGGVPSSAGLGSPTTAARKTMNLPPRNKLPPNATTAMEFLQKNVNK